MDLKSPDACRIELSATEFYSSLNNNVVNGLINGIHVINIFGALSIAKSVYLFERSFATGCRAICINDDIWASFDDTLKQIVFEELQGEQIWNQAVEHWTKSSRRLRRMGHPNHPD